MDENFVAFSYAMTMGTDELERAFHQICERLLYEVPGNSDVLSLSNIFTAYSNKSTIECNRALRSERFATDELNRVLEAVRRFSDGLLGDDYE